MADQSSAEIGKTIDDAMTAIEKENKELKGVLPKNFARPELDKRRPGEVMDIFTNIAMHKHGGSKDILGRAYEYCLGNVRWKYGIPPAGNANFAWLQHRIHHLSAKGRLGMVLANGSLSSQCGGKENAKRADPFY
jgi:type I restriction-modification system DNA methylase subunit